jgi:hypothetical protein
MASAEDKPFRTLSWQDLAISIVSTWLGEKVLDFLLKKIRLKITLEGKSHFKRYLFVMFGNQLLMFIFGWLLGSPKDTESSEFGESVDRFLKLHRRYHQFAGRRPCSACYAIYWNRLLFEKFVPDPKIAHERTKQFSKHALNF